MNARVCTNLAPNMYWSYEDMACLQFPVPVRKLKFRAEKSQNPKEIAASCYDGAVAPRAGNSRSQNTQRNECLAHLPSSSPLR